MRDGSYVAVPAHSKQPGELSMPKMKMGRKGKFNLKGDMKRGAGSKKSGKSASVKSM